MSRIPVSSKVYLIAVIFENQENYFDNFSSQVQQTPPGKTNEFQNDICGLRISIKYLLLSQPVSVRLRIKLADSLKGFIFTVYINIYPLLDDEFYNSMTEAKNATQIIDKTTRNRIFNSRFWKEECFALNAESFIDKAVLLKSIGGLYGGAKKPTKFLCLLFKMLQMNLSEEIVMVYLGQKEYKYLNALALLYLRLVLKSPTVYEVLEPFYVDNRKLRVRNSLGRYQLTYVDQFVDNLLNNEICLGLALPFLQKRLALQLQGVLDTRRSLIEQELNGVEAIKEENEEED